MESLRVALTRPTSLYKGGNGEEFESLCLFNIQKKGTGKNPIPLLSNHHKIDFLFIFNRNINPKIIFSFWIHILRDYEKDFFVFLAESFELTHFTKQYCFSLLFSGDIRRFH